MKRVMSVLFFVLLVNAFAPASAFAFDYPRFALLITDIGLTKDNIRSLYKDQGVTEGNIPNSLAGGQGSRVWVFNGDGRCEASVIVIHYTGTSVSSDLAAYWKTHGYSTVSWEENDSASFATQLVSANQRAFIQILDNKQAGAIELSVTSATGSPYDAIPFLGEWQGRSKETGQFHTYTFTMGAGNKILFEEHRVFRGAKVPVEKGEVDLFPGALMFFNDSGDGSRRITFSWSFNGQTLMLLDSPYTHAQAE